MMRSSHFIVCIAVAMLIQSAPATAQQSPVALSDLAVAWSGGGKPTCAPGPGEADFPAFLRLQNCTWPAVGRDAHFGQVTGGRTERDGLLSLTWERHVADSVAAKRISDSLGTKLRARGLKEYACPNRGRRWQTTGLVIQFIQGAVFADGLLRLSVFATTLPNTVPDFVCPNVPKVAPSPSRDRATQAG